jgi:hypothetical protein
MIDNSRLGFEQGVQALNMERQRLPVHYLMLSCAALCRR